MRSISKLALIASIFLLFSSQAIANEEVIENSYFSKASIKLLAGVANLATGWVEFPKNIILTGQKDTPVSGLTILTLGVLQGAWYTINRTGCGVLDLVTFMIPTDPLVDPVFVWNDFLRETEFKGYQLN
ncbi:exosortase system-associated protein, TIGR04073 family [Nitrosomonas supralitoralis]|uniref:Exosortase system-associated protein, TIGR04073 family n=1 Tax=Nitrosomonas supralitoralis TaxID=2116706 RepID=A0A2P7NUW9_9PROT|nr:exosortase system-associated protein, TIGR04073 family [Nitrosomonas supralitoralis]PSJ17266.1 exosortase system-associated protein, TIGR04073 family [Nitrosomonas supralitoralis]